jgi:predicted O-methyltransferase YrrM
MRFRLFLAFLIFVVACSSEASESIIEDNDIPNSETEIVDEKNNDKFTINIREFNKFILEDKRVEQLIFPLGDGMTVCRVL